MTHSRDSCSVCVCVREFGCKYDVCIYSNATPNTLALGLTPCLCILRKNVGMCGLTPCLVANVPYDERYKCLRTLGESAEPHSERLNLGFTRRLCTQVPQERCYLTYNRKPQCKLIFRGGESTVSATHSANENSLTIIGSQKTTKF